MIRILKGTVAFSSEKHVIIMVGGIGYLVALTPPHIASLSKEKGEVTLWTHMAVREDSQNLYGFIEKGELDFFELLISISGIGPKTALGILTVSSLPALRKAVSSGDTSHLTKVSGIGRKLADKIVLELKGKFLPEEGDGLLADEVDALEALKALGYKHNDAREALKDVPSHITDTGARIKAALKTLGK